MYSRSHLGRSESSVWTSSSSGVGERMGSTGGSLKAEGRRRKGQVLHSLNSTTVVYVILSAAKDLKLRILRSFAVGACPERSRRTAQDDEAAIHRQI